MSKDFFELFSKYNPLKAKDTEEYSLDEHIHTFYKTPQGGAKYVCNCGKSMSNDEVFETDLSTSIRKLSETEEILDLIDKMMKNPPMRGDIALSDLKRQILEMLGEQK
jgi:hypothetical protein